VRILRNVFHLGVKELRSLGRDILMLVLIGFSFTAQVYLTATGLPESLHKAPIAIVDEDRSPLSSRIVNAFYPPHFLTPELIDQYATDPGATCWPAAGRPSSSTSTPRACRNPSSATVISRTSSPAR
jgi:ABC-2 type transport system permease protein